MLAFPRERSHWRRTGGALEAGRRRAGQAEDGAGNVGGNVTGVVAAATHLGGRPETSNLSCVPLRSVFIELKEQAGNVHDGAQANEPA